MPKRLTCLILLGMTLTGAALYHPGSALATNPVGYESTLVAKGRLGEMNVLNYLPRDPGTSENEKRWLSLQKSKGASDVYVQSNAWAPGGNTGWHSHPGHSLIIVTAGTVTDYEGHDPNCKPHLYKKGMAFVDPGGDHVHIIRNEGDVEAKTIAVQLVPAGAARRVDVADPGICHF